MDFCLPGELRIAGNVETRNTLRSLRVTHAIYPSGHRAFVLKFRLLFRVLECFVQSVGHAIPVFVTTEKIEMLFAFMLTDGKSGSGTTHDITDNLFRIPSMVMARINWRITNYFRTAD